jgi:aminopeptidase-like protein
VTAKGLQGSFEVITQIISAFETSLFPMCTVLGEPQLGKRGLYPTISQKGTYQSVQLRKNTLAYSDGQTNVFELATKIKEPLKPLVDELRLLMSYGLIRDGGSDV